MSQGKLHSSPFHVENAFYKYAVEHETSDYNISQDRIDCPYTNKTNTVCNLWNSGFNKCLAHKCMFYLDSLHRKGSCVLCAFNFEGHCFHEKKPSALSIIGNEAEYCAFFFSNKSNVRRYDYIKGCCARLYYTQLAVSYEKKIASKKRYISQCRKELNTQRANNEDKTYLNRKIENKLQEKCEIQLALNRCLEHLSEIGGKLVRFPAKNDYYIDGSGVKTKDKRKPHSLSDLFF